MTGTAGVGASGKDHAGDARLIERVLAGDVVAVTDLYHRYAHSIHGVAVQLTGSAADADDVLQDVFVELSRALRSFEGRGSLEGWLRRVAVRRSLMLLRKRRIRGEVSLDPRTAAGDHVADRVVNRVAVCRALTELPEHLRAVVVLKEVDGYTHEEIARLLGIQPENSMVRLHRAKKRLRTLLGEGS